MAPYSKCVIRSRPLLRAKRMIRGFTHGPCAFSCGGFLSQLLPHDRLCSNSTAFPSQSCYHNTRLEAAMESSVLSPGVELSRRPKSSAAWAVRTLVAIALACPCASQSQTSAAKATECSNAKPCGGAAQSNGTTRGGQAVGVGGGRVPGSSQQGVNASATSAAAGRAVAQGLGPLFTAPTADEAERRNQNGDVFPTSESARQRQADFERLYQQKLLSDRQRADVERQRATSSNPWSTNDTPGAVTSPNPFGTPPTQSNEPSPGEANPFSGKMGPNERYGPNSSSLPGKAPDQESPNCLGSPTLEENFYQNWVVVNRCSYSAIFTYEHTYDFNGQTVTGKAYAGPCAKTLLVQVDKRDKIMFTTGSTEADNHKFCERIKN